MDSQHIPQSLFYAQRGIGGTWVDAQWSAALTDDATGEILATAINPNDGQPTDWAMIGIRLNRDFLAAIRQLAGIDAPLPADTARAEAAYWRDIVQTAVDLLGRGRTTGQDWRHNALEAEGYLRHLLSFDASPSIPSDPPIPSTPSDADFAFTREQLERVLLDAIAMFIEYRDVHGKSEQDAPHYAAREIEQGLDADIELASRGEYQSPKRSTSAPFIPSTDCYDCRTLTERELVEDVDTFGNHARRIDEVRERLDDWVLAQMPHRDARLATIEQRLDDLVLRAVFKTTHIALAKRVDALERKHTSAAVHLAQVPNAVKRINELDQLLQAVIKDFIAIEERLETLESTKPQPLSAVDALRQIANIQARDPDGLKMTWSEMALSCIRIAEKALESA